MMERNMRSQQLEDMAAQGQVSGHKENIISFNVEYMTSFLTERQAKRVIRLHKIMLKNIRKNDKVGLAKPTE